MADDVSALPYTRILIFGRTSARHLHHLQIVKLYYKTRACDADDASIWSSLDHLHHLRFELKYGSGAE